MDNVSLAINKLVKSIFCNKSGTLKVADDYFLNQQNFFLLKNGAERAKQCLPYFN